jgi:hypothetical protein
MPFRLPVGEIAIELLEAKPAAIAGEYAAWRERSAATALDAP